MKFYSVAKVGGVTENFLVSKKCFSAAESYCNSV